MTADWFNHMTSGTGSSKVFWMVGLLHIVRRLATEAMLTLGAVYRLPLWQTESFVRDFRSEVQHRDGF